MSEDQIPAQWRKGMRRALDRKIKATKLPDGSYRVPSGSTTVHYRIRLDAHGKVGPCDATCKARQRYGDDYVCAHRGAVALAEMFLKGIVVEPATVVEQPRTTRQQVYREEAA